MTNGRLEPLDVLILQKEVSETDFEPQRTSERLGYITLPLADVSTAQKMTRGEPEIDFR